MTEKSNANAAFSSASKSQVLEMGAAVEARSLIEEIAGPQALGGKIKSALDRVARRTGLSNRRVRGLWAGEAKAIRSEEMDALRRVAKKVHTNELNDFAARLAAVEARLATLDADFHGPSLDALRDLHGRIRDLADGAR